ncbi:unnamed protein product [Cercospora beticola]|nr:unnamed protein product [Cercospora beticola]
MKFIAERSAELRYKLGIWNLAGTSDIASQRSLDATSMSHFQCDSEPSIAKPHTFMLVRLVLGKVIHVCIDGFRRSKHQATDHGNQYHRPASFCSFALRVHPTRIFPKQTQRYRIPVDVLRGEVR